MAPYPFRLEPLEDFDPLVDFDMTGGDDVWFARPQLFFTCSLCPTERSQDKSSHREVSLVFFSTFEPISLTPNSFMQRSGIPMVYERAASQLPTLYVCPVENVLGRVPLILCYLAVRRCWTARAPPLRRRCGPGPSAGRSGRTGPWECGIDTRLLTPPASFRAQNPGRRWDL